MDAGPTVVPTVVTTTTGSCVFRPRSRGARARARTLWRVSRSAAGGLSSTGSARGTCPCGPLEGNGLQGWVAHPARIALVGVPGDRLDQLGPQRPGQVVAHALD